MERHIKERLLKHRVTTVLYGEIASPHSCGGIYFTPASYHVWECASRRRSTNLSVSKIKATIFEVAKAIQYIHSLVIALDYTFDAADVYLDSNTRVKFQCPYFEPIDVCEGQHGYARIGRVSTLEHDILKFGRLFNQVLLNHKVRNIPDTRPSEPEIPDSVWKLMHWCCAEEPEERPTIDQVVQEMESWISLGQFTLSA
ncbi:hypothetical protein JOM56_011012 [Amanita muscaria]